MEPASFKSRPGYRFDHARSSWRAAIHLERRSGRSVLYFIVDRLFLAISFNAFGCGAERRGEARKGMLHNG